MTCRGVRGATTTEDNSRDAILTATRQLLALMIRQNAIQPEDVASAIFTTTTDLTAEFPALAARQLGWLEVPLLCATEIDVPGGAAALRADPAPLEHADAPARYRARLSARRN